jgi:NAD-reducing hydrogenase large subunit
LNVADRCGTPEADAEFEEYHQRFGKMVESSFHFHYARLIEALYALERMEMLWKIRPSSTRMCVRMRCQFVGGRGHRGSPARRLIHHYKVDEKGAMKWANLIVATGHNNLAINRSIEQVAKRFVNGKKLEEGMLNRVSAVVRAYDPCFSCSTHALNQPAMEIKLFDVDGTLVDTLRQ